MELKQQLVLILGALCLILPSGCEPLPCSSCSEETGWHRVTLGLGDGGIVTKTAGVTPESETAIQSCRLYVFTGEGTSLTGSWTDRDGVFDLYLPDGTYDFFVVANKDGLPVSGLTFEALKHVPVFLSDNEPGRFVMTGALSGHEVKQDEELLVDVSRTVAKVSCCIRQDLRGKLADSSFEVEEVFMTNVAGENDLGLTWTAPPVDGRWYNPMEYTPAAGLDLPDAMLHCEPGRMLERGDSLVLGDVFYVFPNAVETDSHDRDAWSPRCTRLVVAARLEGVRVYYAVTIPRVQPNRHYHIDLTIRNRGMEHPEDDPKGYVPAVVSITTDDWHDGGTVRHVF